MKVNVQLAAPSLSRVGKVSLETEMTAAHYMLLAGKTSSNEVLVENILSDLVDCDASQLNLTEIYHLFTLVKCVSLGGKLGIRLSCPCKVKDSVCGSDIQFEYRLEEGDVLREPKGYKVPTVQWDFGNGLQTWSVIPPALEAESFLFDWFETEKEVTRENIISKNDPDMLGIRLEYSQLRSLLHLCTEDKEPFIKNISDYQSALDSFKLKTNTFSSINSLLKYVNEEASFGVNNKTINIVCKECGGNFNYHLPLLSGISY